MSNGEISYDGPPELVEDWRAFAISYIGDDEIERRYRNLATLNELVFQLPNNVEQGEDKRATAINTFIALQDYIENLSDGEYDDLRRDLHEVIHANSKGQVGNQLNRAIVGNLIDMWISLEVAMDLSAIPTTANMRKSEEWAAHERLYESPEGTLVSAALFAAVDGVLVAQSNAIWQQWKAKGITYDNTYSLAFDELKLATYRYEKGAGHGEGATFFTYLTMRLKFALQRRMVRSIDEAVSLNSFVGEEGDTELGDLIEDKNAVSPFEAASLADDGVRIDELLEALDERERRIIDERFGLKGDKPKTLEEVAQGFGVTRERIRQLQNIALKKLERATRDKPEAVAPEIVQAATAPVVRTPPKPQPKPDPAPAAPPAKPVTPEPAAAEEKGKDIKPETREAIARIELDMKIGAVLAEEEAGARIDLVQEGIPDAIADALEALLSTKGEIGTALFGVEDEELRVSQDETLGNTVTILREGETSGYGVQPGGSGKTRIGIAYCAAAKDAAAKVDHSMRSLYIVPSLAAADSVRDKFKAVRPDISVGRVYDGHADFGKDVTVIVYSSLYRHFYRSLIAQAEDESYPFNIRDYRLIVGDEAHLYLTELADHVFANTDAVRIALTATDKYYEGKEVAAKFGRLINRVGLDAAILRNEILKPTYRCVEATVDLGLDSVYNLDGRDELYSEEIETHVNNPEWNKVFVDLYLNDRNPETGERIFGDKAFTHCAGIGHATDMAEAMNEQILPLLKTDENLRAILREKGIDPDKVTHVAAPISHKLTPKKRKALMEAYDRREILMLTSSKMLIESVDNPETGVIFNAVPTYSRVRSAQRGYRGSRMHPGKGHWIIYEVLPAGWDEAKYAPILFAEAAEDPEVQGLQGKPIPAEGEKRERRERPTVEGVTWEMLDIAEVIQKLYLIRLKRRGLHALNPDWLEEHDNQRGRYLEALRLRAGLSRKDAGEQIGVCDGTIFNWERGQSFNDISMFGVAEVIERMRPVYDTSPEEEQRLLYLFLPALDPKKFAEISEDRRLGSLLKAYRMRAGVTAKPVAEILGKDEQNMQTILSGWERGTRKKFDHAWHDFSVLELVDSLSTVYNLTEEESQGLLCEFLPALNPEWLAQQPENRQVGLLLHAYRRRGSSFSYEEAIDALGLSFNWEKRGGIIASKLPMPLQDLLGRIQKHYGLDCAEREDLLLMILPALDPKKLAEMPEDKQCGRLLAAFRERESLRLDEVADQIGAGFTFGTISNWERNRPSPVNQSSYLKQHLNDLFGIYKLKSNEKAQITALVLPHLTADWLDQKPAKERAGYMLTAYRQICGISREEMGEILGRGMAQIGLYEKAEHPMPADVFAKAKMHFRGHCGELYDEEAFAARVEESSQAFTRKEKPVAAKVSAAGSGGGFSDRIRQAPLGREVG